MNSRASDKELVLVDTSAWICFFARRGYQEIKTCLKSLLDNDQVATAGPITVELLQGCRSLEEMTQLEERLQALHWLVVQDRHWLQAGHTAFALRRVGITLSALDVLIATLADSYGLSLLQQDSDFELMSRHTRLRLATFK